MDNRGLKSRALNSPKLELRVDTREAYLEVAYPGREAALRRGDLLPTFLGEDPK